jgi:hypothetical protein
MSASEGVLYSMYKHMYNGNTMAFIVEGNCYPFRQFMLGRVSYEHRQDGRINPTFTFTFKSGGYAQSMHDSMLVFQQNNYPIIPAYPKTLPSVWKSDVFGNTAFINFVVAPKCIVNNGMFRVFKTLYVYR